MAKIINISSRRFMPYEGYEEFSKEHPEVTRLEYANDKALREAMEQLDREYSIEEDN